MGPFLDKSVLHWINDGMVVFFFWSGWRLSEVLRGELSSFDKALFADFDKDWWYWRCIGYLFWFEYTKMVVFLPDGLFCGYGYCFSLGILALLGSRASYFFENHFDRHCNHWWFDGDFDYCFFIPGGLSAVPLLIAGLVVLGLLALNQKQGGCDLRLMFCWFCFVGGFVEIGMHPTIGGVLSALLFLLCEVALLTPVETLWTCFAPLVVYMILPLFAFANAGVSFEGMKVG